MIAGYTTGIISDKYGKPFLMAQIGTGLVYLALLFSYLAYFLESYIMCFFCAIIWGFTETYYEMLVAIIIS